MPSNLHERIASAVAGKGASTPRALARVDDLLRKGAARDAAPGGLRRNVLAAISSGAIAPTPRRRETALLGPWSLVAAACLALFVGVLAMRQPTVAPPPSKNLAKLGQAQKSLSTGVKKLPSAVEAPLMDEARRLAQDTRRAAIVVSAAWHKPIRLTPATTAAPGAAPAPQANPAPAPSAAPVTPR